MNNLCNNALLLALTLRYFCSSVFLLFCSSNIGARPTSSFFQAHRRTPRPRRERVLLKEKKTSHTKIAVFETKTGVEMDIIKTPPPEGYVGGRKINSASLCLYICFLCWCTCCVGRKNFCDFVVAISVIGKRQSFVLCLFISDVHSATGKPLYYGHMCAVNIEGFYTRAHTHTHTLKRICCFSIDCIHRVLNRNQSVQTL
jgi:hypothetical protein